MSTHVCRVLLVLAAIGAPATRVCANDGMIAGVVVDGTDQRRPLAGAEVVLRAGSGNELVPIATVNTDARGRFAFAELDTDPTIVYLPGANRHGVHYPGNRIRLDRQHSYFNVSLEAYDAIESPSPLVARSHRLAFKVDNGFIDVTETLVIDNPTRTAYVGETREDHPTITLRLELPEGFETVTFDKEFHGRNFLVNNNTLVTDQPWPPGQRELTYTYRLPVDNQSAVLQRKVSIPTDTVTVRVTGQDPRHLSCNLPAAPNAGGELVFFHQGSQLPAGWQLELRLGKLSVPWERYAPWSALGVLSALLAFARFRKGREATSPVPPPVQAARPSRSARLKRLASLRK